MKVLDLFSGIGGISYGLESTGGFQTVGFCEIDKFCNMVLEKHWPEVPRFEDIKALSAEDVRLRCGSIDLIAGGFPCQPHSVAGKRKGQSDERHLWPEFARLVRELRPTWVLAENVPGIRSTAADEVIGDLEAEGYTVWPLVVGADDVGAPHRRKRVWFVARLRLADGDGAREPDEDELWRQKRKGRAGEADAVGHGADVAHRDGERGLVSTQRKHAAIEISDSDMQETRWPSRPGEPQHEWEEPRLSYGECTSWKSIQTEPTREIATRMRGLERVGEESRSPQLPLGSTTDGLSLRLVRRSNREALKAYGNSVVPQVVYCIGLAILGFERSF